MALFGAAARKAGWSFLRAYSNLPLSQNAIRSKMRLAGFGWRDGLMNADIAGLRGLGISKRALQGFPKFLTPEAHHTSSTPRNLKDRYLVEYEVNTQDRVSGEETRYTYSQYTNRLTSIGNMEDSMLVAIEKEERYNYLMVVDIRISNVFDRSKEAPF